MRAQKCHGWLGLVKAVAPSASNARESGLTSSIAGLCNEYQDVFGEPGVPPHRELDHRIDLVDEAQRPPKPK